MLLGHYDSIILYASTVATMMTEKDANFTNGYEIVARLTNSSFQGVRGNAITIGEDRQRDKNYMVQVYESKSQEFVVGCILFSIVCFHVVTLQFD